MHRTLPSGRISVWRCGRLPRSRFKPPILRGKRRTDRQDCQWGKWRRRHHSTMAGCPSWQARRARGRQRDT